MSGYIDAEAHYEDDDDGSSPLPTIDHNEVYVCFCLAEI
jgi:hypothetical protein